jgi:hypothetical protein
LLIACIARLLLHATERNAVQTSDTTSAESRHALDIESEIAVSMLKLARSLESTGRCDTEEISPFCVEAMYRAGIFYARQFRSTGDQRDLEALECAKTGLAVMNNRWKSTGIQFLKLLFAHYSDILLQGHTLKC